MESKEKFLKKYNILNNKQNMLDCAKQLFESTGCGSYNAITGINAHSSVGVLEKDLEEFILKLYERYHKLITQKYDFSKTSSSEKCKQFCQDLKTKPELQPQNLDMNMFRYYFLNPLQEKYKTYFDCSPILSQNASQCFNPYGKKYGETASGDFFHIKSIFFQGKIDCRLYLNVKTENTIKLATKIIERPEYEDNLYFKFGTLINRSDTMLFYTSYENADKIIKMLDDLKEQNPKLFEGCEKTGFMLAPIHGYIGFGEEPKLENSFNEARATVLDSYKNELNKKLWKKAGNFNGIFKKSTEPKVMNLQQCINYIILKNLKKQNRLTDEQVKNISPECKKTIDETANECIKKMKQCEEPKIAYGKTVTISGKNCDLSWVDITPQLFLLFGYEHDEALLKQKCEKCHVSFEHPSLNTETIKELNTASQSHNA